MNIRAIEQIRHLAERGRRIASSQGFSKAETLFIQLKQLSEQRLLEMDQEEYT